MAISDKKYSALLARMRRQRQEGRSMIMTVVESVESGASASTHGFIDGYFGGVSVVGVPLGFITGSALHLFGALGLAPEHMHALGNGAFAAPIAEMSRQWGEDMAKGAPAGAASGRRLFAGAGAQRLSLAELQALANA
jgi:hypothetical protein